MIARLWHGITHRAKSDRYLEYLKETGVKDYVATEGNKGVYVLRRMEGDRAHFLIISLWNSFSSIEKFAGKDIEKAVYYPEDKDYLLEFEPSVQHYEVLEERR